MFKLFILLLCSSAIAQDYSCANSHKRVSAFVRNAAYDFSVRILDRVSRDTSGHFVFSPLSTWIQLMILAEGARGPTLYEILKTARYRLLRCNYRKKMFKILNSINDDLGDIAKFRSYIVIDKLLDIKETYKQRIEDLNVAKVMAVNFNDKNKSADSINQVVKHDMDGVIIESVYAEDFALNMLLMADTDYMKADWRSPFNPVFTTIEPFYGEEKGQIGKVNMMHQIGYFNTTDIPCINARALELPFNDRLTMILLLPTKGSVLDIYKEMENTSLVKIFSSFNEAKQVNVKMPRFNITTDHDNIPVLINDMGATRMFYPDKADFKRISDFKMHTSMMTQIANVEVTEKGVSARVVSEYLLRADNPTDFILDRPFAYLIVHKKLDLILFAGIYSQPSIFKN